MSQQHVSSPLPTPPGAPPVPTPVAPRVVSSLMLLALLAGIGTLAYGLIFTPRYLPQNNVFVPSDSSPASYNLQPEQTYGFYSTDPEISCTATDPADHPLTITSTRDGGAAVIPQVLSFRSRAQGAYTVSCSGNGEIFLNIAEISAERNRGRAFTRWGAVATSVLAPGFIASGIWFLLVRRRATRALPAPPPGGAGGPLAAGRGPTPASAPSSPDAARPRATPGVPAPPVHDPVPPSQEEAEAAGRAGNPDSSPAVGRTPAPPVRYGIAPQPVAYRPLPPPAPSDPQDGA